MATECPAYRDKNCFFHPTADRATFADLAMYRTTSAKKTKSPRAWPSLSSRSGRIGRVFAERYATPDADTSSASATVRGPDRGGKRIVPVGVLGCRDRAMPPPADRGSGRLHLAPTGDRMSSCCRMWLPAGISLCRVPRRPRPLPRLPLATSRATWPMHRALSAQPTWSPQRCD